MRILAEDNQNIREPTEFHTNYIIYEPIEDRINYKPRVVFGRKKKKPVKIPKKKKKELIEDFSITLASVTQKEIKDDDFAYFVLEFFSSPVSWRYERVLRNMQIKLLAFLDKAQRRALVESRTDISGDRVVKETREIVKNVRPQNSEEKIEEALRGSKEKTLVIVNTIPNIDVDKILQHTQKIRNYINHHNGEALYDLIDRQNARGSVLAYATGELVESLANNSTIMFSAYRVPETILSVINKKRQKKKISSEASLALSSLDSHNSKQDQEYEIIEIDSGAKDLQQFQGRVISMPALSKFPDGDDKDNHGTPIAGLLLYGETDGRQTLSTPFKVRSLKAYQERNRPVGYYFEYDDIYSSIKEALDKYGENSKVFVSSANFDQFNRATEEETRKIDMLIQSKNVCFVNSAGNIMDVVDQRNAGKTKTSLWENHRVFHPSDATSITSVGAYCKRMNYLDGTHENYPACFSRFKSDSVVQKPEVLEHGGTLLVEELNPQEYGVMTINSEGRSQPRIGTSFAAPLFARHLAFIYKALRNDIFNAETIKAIAYSCCHFTKRHDAYCGLGYPDFSELTTTQPTVARIIFEGEFKDMNSQTIPVHDIIIEIRSQPVEVELFLVHSDNYRLPTLPGNYTAIMVDGTKGQVSLQEKRNKNRAGTWTHVKKLVYGYQKNSVATWRFRLEPKLDNIPIAELPNLKIRYGGVIVIRADEVPEGFDSVKSAIDAAMKQLIKAGKAVKAGII